MLPAQVDARDASGCTALHRAAAQGNQRVLQRLLQHGAVASLTFQAGPDSSSMQQVHGIVFMMLPPRCGPVAANFCLHCQDKPASQSEVGHSLLLGIFSRRVAPRRRTWQHSRAEPRRWARCWRRVRTPARATPTAPRRCTRRPPARPAGAARPVWPARARCSQQAPTRAPGTAAATRRPRHVS